MGMHCSFLFDVIVGVALPVPHCDVILFERSGTVVSHPPSSNIPLCNFHVPANPEADILMVAPGTASSYQLRSLFIFPHEEFQLNPYERRPRWNTG
jgi:hypothetical protein